MFLRAQIHSAQENKFSEWREAYLLVNGFRDLTMQN